MISATVTGHLTADAEGRFDDPGASPVVMFSLASNRKKRNEWVADFVRCKIRRHWASSILDRLRKTAHVVVMGELMTFRHNDGGLDLEMVVEKLEFLDRSDTP